MTQTAKPSPQPSEPPMPNLVPIPRSPEPAPARAPCALDLAPEPLDGIAETLDRAAGALVARATGGVSPATLVQSFSDWWTHLAMSPGKQLTLAAKSARKTQRLMDFAMRALEQDDPEPAIEPLAQDRRFSDPAWKGAPYNLVSQAFLLNQQWWHAATTGVGGVSAHHEQVVEFATRQVLDMFAPTNFVATNPVLQQRILETGGRCLADGARHLFEDVRRTMRGEPLEDRVKRFIEAEPNNESLDGASFDQVNGSATKADYLIGQRRLIAELKTINGDPKDRVEQRLRERFRQPDAPYVIGRYGLAPVLENMPDRQPLTKVINDLQSRAVRRHLQKANEQIGATKARLGLSEAAGLVVLMNDSEPMIDAANMAYAVKTACETVEGGYPHINYVWINVERHKVALSKRPGFPQLLITRTPEPPPHFPLLLSMLEAWAQFNGAQFFESTAFQGDWSLLSPIYDDGPPELDIY